MCIRSAERSTELTPRAHDEAFDSSAELTQVELRMIVGAARTVAFYIKAVGEIGYAALSVWDSTRQFLEQQEVTAYDI